jgi:hypothetical protein
MSGVWRGGQGRRFSGARAGLDGHGVADPPFGDAWSASRDAWKMA